MKATNMKNAISRLRLFLAPIVALLVTTAAYAAAPGITGPTFHLIAQSAYITQPDGQMIYSWGYGCNGAPSGFAPAAITNTFCNTMQVPGPTLVVTEGQTVTVILRNGLPTAAGGTSILFPGFNVTATGGVTGLLTNEAAPGAHPVLSGGTEIRGWKPSVANPRVWVARAPGNLATRQLYVDGERAPVASGAPPVTLTQTAIGYTAATAAMAAWRNPSARRAKAHAPRARPSVPARRERARAGSRCARGCRRCRTRVGATRSSPGTCAGRSAGCCPTGRAGKRRRSRCAQREDPAHRRQRPTRSTAQAVALRAPVPNRLTRPPRARFPGAGSPRGPRQR